MPLRSRPLRLSLAASLLWLCPASLAAATLLVPTDFPTIQMAIDAALPGDVVEVAPGVFVENLDLLGKAITLRGAGIDETVIDGSAATFGVNNASVIRCESGETEETIIEDVTLTGGTGSLRPAVINAPIGGGIMILDAVPTIRRVRVTDCITNGASGLWAQMDPGTTWSLSDCQFDSNLANRGTVIVDGGSNLLVERCRFEDNIGGLAGAGAHLHFDHVVVRECEFLENNVSAILGVGGGLALMHPNFAGADIETALIEDCLFQENVSPLLGAAIVSQADDLTVRRTHFIANDSPDLGVVFSEGATRIENCFSFGTESPDGVLIGLLNGEVDPLTIDHCTFAGENALAIARQNGHPITITNTIVWGNSSLDLFEVGGGPAATQVEYSCIEGGFPGVGNIALDPLFVDLAGGDLRLQPDSPCVDAGDPTAPLDFDGSATDMGAFPFASLFRRGDANQDGGVHVADAVAILGFLLFGDAPLSCEAAADANDSGQIDLADPIYTLNRLFQNGPDFPAPTIDCGPDPTLDLSCALPGGC